MSDLNSFFAGNKGKGSIKRFMSDADAIAKIKSMGTDGRLSYVNNPKKAGAAQRYAEYSKCKTIGEYIKKASEPENEKWKADLIFDVSHGYDTPHCTIIAPVVKTPSANK